MTTFQLLLFIVAGAILYLFFKQLFSNNYPKRGVDFEAKVADEQIGGINRADKTFSTPKYQPSRIEQLLSMAKDAIEKEDFEEAQKALGSALIVEPENVDALQQMGYVCTQTRNYNEAKEQYEKLIDLDESDDMAQALLANTLHQLKEHEQSIMHHQKAIELDSEYAPHYFNYANTLYDLDDAVGALENYKKAYEIDDTLKVAKDMINKLESING